MAFGSEQWMYNAGGGFYPYEIGQSLRFNDDDSAYLSRTPASAGNRKTWTWSGWVKRGDIDTYGVVFSGYTDNNNQLLIRVEATGVIRIFQDVGGPKVFDLTTSAVYRDPSSWYHIIVSLDSTESTSSDRLKLYVNGEQVTSFSTSSYPALNTDYEINSTTGHFIGQRGNSEDFFDGYMAEVNFVDGQALDPTDFGETKSGVWIPKSYAGTYGTNGFYLDFGNAGSLGADVSGNGNNWTPTNLASTDQVPDSPTNNFATLNPLAKGSNITLSNGNLQYTQGATTDNMVLSTMGVSSGKWYAEMRCGAKSNCGIATNSANTGDYLGSDVNGWSYYVTGNGNIYHNGSNSAYGSVGSEGDVVGIALDLDAGTLTFYLNNVSQGTAASGLADNTYFICMGLNNTSGSVFNYGQDSSFAGNKTAQGNTDANGIGDFYYAPPAGYLALCSANLPDPAIDPAEDDVPADYFNTVLYTATGNDNLAITGVGFQPDFTWIKSRSSAYSHNVYDAVRGVSKRLQTNLTNAESSPISGVKSFDADGFTLGNDTNDTNFTSGVTYVAWNWKAGGSAVANTDGTIASQVSANTKSGFSIVTYTGNGTAGATVGHGLDSAPDIVIVKSRNDSSENWTVYSSSLGNTKKLELNLTEASATTSNWNNTSPTASVVSLGTVDATNQSGNTFVAYCFHSVEGFSKFGSYEGNGSTDGPFIYTGFRPAYVMVKNTDVASDWWIYDTDRQSYNVMGPILYPNLSSVEYATDAAVFGRDLLSNGFKVRNANTYVNGSGSTYIYMAFAEQPFKYANAR